MWLVWLVFFFVVPFFIQISHALLFFRGHSGPGYRDNEGRGSGSAGLLAAAPVEPELLASSGLLLWGGCRAATMPAEEPPPSFDLGLQSQLLAAATGLGVDAGAGEEAAACASVEELLRASSGLLDGRTRAQAEGRWRVLRRGRDGAAAGSLAHGVMPQGCGRNADVGEFSRAIPYFSHSCLTIPSLLSQDAKERPSSLHLVRLIAQT